MIKFCMTRFELSNNWRVVKIQMNSISEDMDSSDENNSDDKDADFIYISDKELDFVDDNDVDDKNEDKKDGDKSKEK
jgi:hypothetical protein